MNNIIVPNYYSNTFVCQWTFTKDISDIDSIFEIITFHLSQKFGDKYIFYVSLEDLVVTSSQYHHLSTLMSSFSNIQKDMSLYISRPIILKTGDIPKTGVYWEVLVRHGAIESTRKLS